MTDFAAQRFSIDSALELVADHWSADTPDSTLFRNASLADRVTLKAGLLSGTSPAVITSIEQGVIDEYQIQITPTNIIGSVRGRDPSAKILDSFVDLGFTRPPTAANLDRAFTERLPSFNPATALAPAAQVGRSTAREIAQRAVEEVGLTLQWEVRDYEIVENFQAAGRVADILRRLIDPWTLLEPFKADIYLHGTTVIIRHRQLPDQPLVAPPGNVLTIAATRRSTVTVRKRPFKKLGKVTLRGRGLPEGLSVDENGLFVSGTVTIERVNEAFSVPPPPGFVVPAGSALVPAGLLVQRTVILDTFRVPDRILLRTVKTTFTKGETGPLVMTARETTENIWEPSIYDGGGAINSPKQLGQTIRREILDTEDSLFRDDASEALTYSYDDVGFLTGETTVTRQFDKETDQLELTAMVVKTNHDVAPLISEQIVETFGYDKENLRWLLQSRASTLGGGHRPGGPGRGTGIAGIPSGGGDAFEEVVLERVFSTDPDAMPVEYSNENLTLEDLDFIMAQFEAVQGLFEYEFIFGGVAMPWLKRGVAFKFVEIPAEDGSVFDLPTALITEVKSAYDESSARAKYTMDCRAFGWK